MTTPLCCSCSHALKASLKAWAIFELVPFTTLATNYTPCFPVGVQPGVATEAEGEATVSIETATAAAGVMAASVFTTATAAATTMATIAAIATTGITSGLYYKC